MRRPLLGAVLGSALAALAAPGLLACGDKFVLLGRGLRFSETSRAKHPAAVLIYARPGSEVDAAQHDFRLDSVLKRVGHNPLVVEDASDLQKQLALGRWDIVLTDLQSAAEVQKEGEKITPQPFVIPLLYNSSGEELATAQKQYGCLLKASKKTKDAKDLFGIIDEAMEARAHGAGASCNSSH